VKRLVLGLVLLAVAAPADAWASTPLSWCGTDVSAVDRVPDLSPGFSVHVAYVLAPGAPDRFAEWAPRIVGDVAAIDAWWRTQDATRSPRFDLHDVACSSAFGQLDLSRVPLTAPVGDIRSAFSRIRTGLGNTFGFRQSEKVYLVYFDGPTGQVGPDVTCGEADDGRINVSGMAVVYLDACGVAGGDEIRPIVAAHELVHALGAVERAAPNNCKSGHVCDNLGDLMSAVLTETTLASRLLDAGRNDYYGHAGTWSDVADSRFLDRFDSPDRTAPSVPTAPTITSDRFGGVRFSWGPSSDDVGPVAYRVSRDGLFFDEVSGSSARFDALIGSTSTYEVNAVDGVGRLSATVSLRFTAGLGIVDGAGRLLRDTVPPAPVTKVTVRKLAKRIVLTWAPARDSGGLLGYRVRVGSRLLATAKETLSLPRSHVTAPISIVAVDQAGNAGPATRVPLNRLR